MSIGVTDEIAPLGSFPVVDDTNVKGGYRSVADITARDAIAVNLRKVGMTVRTESTAETWVLGAGLTNGDWSLYIGTPGISDVSYHSLGLHEATNLRTTEVLTGGLFFDPTDFGAAPVVILRLAGSFSSTDVSGSARIYLYDMGPGTGVFTPIRRATVSIPFANVGQDVKVDQTLTLVASPGVDLNQIHNTARVYEARMYLNTVDVGSLMTVQWTGLEVAAA
jgi:hypothetical protein